MPANGFFHVGAWRAKAALPAVGLAIFSDWGAFFLLTEWYGKVKPLQSIPTISQKIRRPVVLYVLGLLLSPAKAARSTVADRRPSRRLGFLKY
jgi:hypothetical protein